MKAFATVLLALSGAAVAIAQPCIDDAAAMSALPSAPPEVQRSGEVSYLNGGAGEEEVRWFKSQAPRYPLQFVISGRGPWVLLDLPPGRYTVEASFDGRVERRTVNVNDKGAQRIEWNTTKASENG